MNTDTIYVLLPAYNVEKFVEESFASLQRQTDDNWICLACDDGSKDNTLKILKSLAQKEKRLKVFHQENKGVGGALNCLLDQVPDSAKYIAFLDSDDVIHPQMLEILRENLVQAKADVAECQISGMKNELPSIDAQRFQKGDYQTRYTENMDLFLSSNTSRPYGRGWILKVNKLYRWQKIKSLRFDEKMYQFEEDYLYSTQVHYLIRSKVIVDLGLYYYRKQVGSVTGTVNWETYQKAGARRIELSDEWFLKEKRLPDNLKAAFCKDLAKDAFRMVVLKPLRRSKRSEKWASKRQQLFKEAQKLMRHLFEIKALKKEYFTFYQRLVLGCLNKGFYHLTLTLLMLK